MELKFSTRQGRHNAFERGLIVKTDDGTQHVFLMSLRTEVRGKITYPDGYQRDVRVRVGEIRGESGVLWTGDLPGDEVSGPAPTRALALAAGLCDENGNTNPQPPAWLE